ncbi:MAG: hypothetical protein RL685_5024 [Pseudomonadota bacterium]
MWLSSWAQSVQAQAAQTQSVPAQSAQAQSPSSAPAAPARRFSALEQERIRRALARVHGTLEPQPAGKRIESIEIVALEVFEPEDPVPQFVNWFHVTTRSYVIERELLFRVGNPYEQLVADETERNLRGLGLFSVVLVLPMRGSSPDTIRYLVLTKDIWSLRVGWDGRFNKGVIDYLSLVPTERNLFGTGRQLFTSLVFGRRTYTVGAGFIEPRLADSRTYVSARMDAVVGCANGDIEGSSGSFEYGRPLASSRSQWGYSTAVSWRNGRYPLDVPFRAVGSICSLRATEEARVALPNGKEAYFPNQLVSDSQSFSQSFVRSFGLVYKTNLSFGLEATRFAAREVDLSGIRAAPSEVDGELTPYEVNQVQRHYRRFLGRNSSRISPFFQIQSYSTEFHHDLNAETLALQEDYRLGQIATLRIYPALKDLGSSRNLLGLQASLSYAIPVGTGYLKASAGQTIELSKLNQTDARLVLALRFNSPRLPLGRFIYDARLVDTYRNFQNGFQVLGGTGRLRGYQLSAEVGRHMVISNLEFRTRPLQIFSSQIAAVVFHDMGDAFERVRELKLSHGVGLGLRFLIPELDRDVFRIDLGLPLPADAQYGETSVIATFHQAFSVP